MRAMVLSESGPIPPDRLQLREIPDPEPGRGEILVRVGACGVCRTDLHVLEEDLEPAKRPLVPGHQVVGRVEKLGPACSRFGIGDRAGIAWLRGTCGRCDPCVTGSENLCEAARFTGHHEDGGYAELAVVPEAFAYRIPDGFSDVEATPLLCGGLIGYRALRRSEIRPGGRLGIFGFGSSAHVTLQVALHWGCKLFVFTRGEARRRQALRMGAAWAGGPADPSPEPLDGAILFAPAGDLVPPALRALRRGGTLAIAGIHLSTVPAMEYEPHLFYEKRLTSVTASTRRDGEELLREAEAIPIRPTTVEYPLREANRALRDLKEGRIEGTAVLLIGRD
jgi:propanol-preferring alcohol dehydrogenase